MTRRFVLLGDPVAHSISPLIHRAAFEALGVDADYVAERVSAARLEAAMRDRRFEGGNVTLPHKLRAAVLVDEASSDAVATGACNCWWRSGGGRLAGDNTDVGGLRAALDEVGIEVAGGRALILGAGGAARAAAHALRSGGAGSIEILNRTPERARRLASVFAGGLVTALDPDRGPVGHYDLVVNATRLGLAPSDPLPLDLGGRSCAAVYDMVYAPGETRWVRHARSRGARAGDGLGMLVHQAALSLERWFPRCRPPVQAMRRAAERALAAPAG